MSVRVSSWVWEHATVSGTDLLVLLAFADQADDNGVCWPSVAYIATKTRLHEDTIRRRLRVLTMRGLVVAEARVGQSSRYRVLTLDPPAECTPPQTATPPQPTPPTPPQDAPTTPPHSLRTRTVNEPSMNRHSFAEFWQTYPRREDKRRAQAEWTRATKRADPETIIAGAARYRDDPNREVPFTKYPSTWLRADSWDNDPLPSRGNVRDLRPNGDIDVNAVLGQDLWSLPAAPDELETGSREWREWCRATQAEHRAERVEQARAVLARRQA